MRLRTWILAGGAFCAAAVVWHFAISPIWQERIPRGWSWRSNFIGIATYADAEGNYPASDESAEHERLYRVAAEDDRPRSIQLEQRVVNRDIDTKEVTWESSFLTPVDPRTGANLGEGYEGHVAVFPRHTEKTAYRLSVGYLKDIPMSFVREEELAGITTYLFHYKGRVEYTDSYAGTEDYEGITVEPGQEIRCNDDQFVVNGWVEPTTGEIVKWEESCYAGDAVFEIETGRKIYEIVRWGGVNRGDETLSRAQSLRWQRLELLAMTRYVPGLLLVLGIGVLGLGVLAHRRGRGASPT